MTRELKLTLIIGTAFLLLVGVLISDHYSDARDDLLAELVEDETPRAPVLPDPQRRPVSRTTPTSTPVVEEPERSPGVLANSGDRPLDSWLSRAIQRATSENQPERATGPIEISQSGPVEQPEQAAGGDRFDDRALAAAIREAGGEIRDGEIVLPGQGQVRAAANRTQPATRSTDEAVWHTVKNGESLYRIAKTYYGDGKRWREIAQANSERIGDEGHLLRVGVRLRIPGVEPERPGPSRSRIAVARAEPTGTSKSDTYTVQKGDTIGEIAQRVLGSARFATRLVDFNSDRIDDADHIRVGMILKIPPV